MNPFQSLLVTPLPMPNESISGLILRTSEMNGYPSPSQMLRIGGMTENEIRSVCPPSEKLSKLFARTPDDFAGLNYVPRDGKQRSKSWRLLNHVVPAIYMGVKSSKICPECILEKGHSEGFWDLKHAIACPDHKRNAVIECPSCRKEIKWQRPGLLECKCGFDLSATRGEICEDQNILDVLTLVKAKLEGTRVEHQVLRDRGFPLKEIEAISFSTLIGIIGRLGFRYKRNRFGAVPNGYSDEMYCLSEACKLLERWPHGFYDYLENMPSEKKKTESYNLQKQFHSFFISMFKSGLPQKETAFLKKAFVTFGNERWQKQGFIDIRLANSANESRTVVGISGLAEYLGVMPPTVMNYVKKGLIKGQVLTCGKRTRRIFDLTKDVPFKPAEGRYYKQREAALFLGLPVNILRDLRRKGIYKVVRLGWGIDGYSELDLIEFRTQLLKTVSQEQEFAPSKHIELGKVFRKKGIPRSGKFQIISGLVDGSIVPSGTLGPDIKHIFLDRMEVDQWLTVL